MENLLIDLKKIVDESRDNGLPNDLIRNRLKEYLRTHFKNNSA